MKYFKISICSLAAFASLSCVQSAENAESKLWAELRGTLHALPTGSLAESTAKSSNEERRRQIDAGFFEIEKKMGFSIPETFKEFHRQVGNLVFSPIFFPTPIDGINSPLYELIMKGKKKKLSGEWVSIGEIDANEYIALNYSTQEITRFTVIPDMKRWGTSPTITVWLRETYLTH